jgi:hypothetical protein
VACLSLSSCNPSAAGWPHSTGLTEKDVVPSFWFWVFGFWGKKQKLTEKKTL